MPLSSDGERGQKSLLGEGGSMRLAWFTHRYFPAIGGAETYGREMVRRFLAAGHEVDVVTSDALDLWYFTDPAARRVEAPRLSELDGARVLRFPVRHVPLQRYLGRLLSYAPHWPTRCRFESFMPIIPGIERVRGAYDAVFGVGFPYTIFSLAGLRTARAAGAPLVLTPFLHLATQGDPVNRLYSRAHQARLLAQSQTVVVQTELENLAVVSLGIPRSRVFTLGMGVDQAEVTGGDRLRLRSRLGIPAECAVIGQLGVNDPNKGTNDLVNAVACLNARRPDDDQIHLILGGASTPAFQSFAAALPGACQRWLHMLGPVTPRDRPNFYSALDVFAMPSRT
ncbi:MAG TPA: glycosyltransferase family 4 protein, partial [Isosphaeraceae bacterium]|nr:glycosyltransferase family 4 protein [Isosphaeraceae bacterium]